LFPDAARFRSNTLCIARGRNKIREQNFRKAPQADCAVLPTTKKGFHPMIQTYHGTKACYFCGTTQIDVQKRPLCRVQTHTLP